MSKFIKRQGMLLTREKASTDEVLKLVRQAKRDVAAIIRDGSRKAINANSRQAVFNEVVDRYDVLADGIDSTIRALSKGGAKTWHQQAVEDIKAADAESGTRFLRFDPSLVNEYFEFITPRSVKGLVGKSFTDKLVTSDLSALRQAFREVAPLAKIEGLTLNEMQKRLQGRWTELAGNLDDHKFLDITGRPWSDRRYLEMMIRTNEQNIARESYMDTITRNGDDLVQIRNIDDTACVFCNAWDNVIISITGSSEKFPSYADAVESGWAHPNCRCQTARVDETLDKDEIDLQSDLKTPADLNDIKAVATYSEEFASVL